MNALPRSERINDREAVAAALRSTLVAVDADDPESFRAALAHLDQRLSRPLRQTLAAIERELRAALGGAQFEDRLAELAGHELPDAATRLDYVIGMTERAAHTTLDLADELRAELTGLDAAGGDTARSARMRALINDLQQAQAYQDLTGQVIRHVVGVMGRAEGALRRALAAAGIEPVDAHAPCGADSRLRRGVERAASTQSDADAVLAGLGF